jgi:Outer membrane protein beta-barrel domain
MPTFSLRRLLALTTLAAALSARAEGLIGASHAGGRFHVLQFGDSMKDLVLGEGFALDAFGATPINDNVDTIIRAGYGAASGNVSGVPVDYSTTTIGTDFLYHFRPDEAINPYLVGGPFVHRWAIDVDNTPNRILRALDMSENRVGASLGSGAQFEIYDTFLAGAELAVQVTTELDVNATARATFGYWVMPQLLTSLGVAYDTDEGDRTYSLLGTWKLP